MFRQRYFLPVLGDTITCKTHEGQILNPQNQAIHNETQFGSATEIRVRWRPWEIFIWDAAMEPVGDPRAMMPMRNPFQQKFSPPITAWIQ